MIKNDQKKVSSGSLRGAGFRGLSVFLCGVRDVFLRNNAVRYSWPVLLVFGIVGVAFLSPSPALATGAVTWSYPTATNDLYINTGATYANRRAEKVSATGEVCSVSFKPYNSSAAAQDWTISLYRGGSTPTGGTFLEDQVISVATGTAQVRTITWDYCYNITTSTPVWVVYDTIQDNTQSLKGGASGGYDWAYIPTSGGWVVTANSSYLYVYAYDSSYYPSSTGAEAIQLRYPFSQTSTFPHFSKFVYDVQGLSSTEDYYVRILPVYVTSSEPLLEEPAQIPASTDYLSGINGTTGGRSVGVTHSLQPSIGRVYTYDIELYLCADSICQYELASSTVRVRVGYGYSVPSSPYAIKAGPHDATNDPLANTGGVGVPPPWTLNADTDWCGDSSGWADIGYGFCRLAEYLIDPYEVSDNAAPFMLDNLSYIKRLYPIKYLYDITDSVKGGLNTAPSDVVLTFDMTIMGHTIEYDLLSSSTLSNVVGTSTKADIFEVEGYVFWAFAIFIVFATVISFF